MLNDIHDCDSNFRCYCFFQARSDWFLQRLCENLLRLRGTSTLDQQELYESMSWLSGTGILPVLAGGIAIHASFTAGMAAGTTSLLNRVMNLPDAMNFISAG